MRSILTRAIEAIKMNGKIKTDFRLPKIEELLTLVDYGICDPACKLKDIKSYAYWSSTAYANDTSLVWGISFYNGCSYGYGKENNCYVKCVRVLSDGKLQWSETSEEKMNWYEAQEYAKNLKAKVYKEK